MLETPDSESTILHQRAINGLYDALHVLRTSPMSTSDLQHALGRSIRGVTAIKRLKALRCLAADTTLDLSASDMQRREAAPPPIFQPALPSKKRRSRRYFDSAYKRQVVHMIRQQHMSVGQASKDFNLTYSAVRRWMMEFDSEQAADSVISGTGKPTMPDAERIQALEARLRQLQSDNELLKKAMALLAR